MISIHALVKRATGKASQDYRVSLYFNPRPREEGDLDRASHLRADRNFNPRLREEGDKLLCFLRYARLISIHALVKRATRPFVKTV